MWKGGSGSEAGCVVHAVCWGVRVNVSYVVGGIHCEHSDSSQNADEVPFWKTGSVTLV